ncbi:MAG TPA: redoxin family protein [Nitrospiraceae bacterium]|nr:redoxin family protein [Nitrospiraceae bacterium]
MNRLHGPKERWTVLSVGIAGLAALVMFAHASSGSAASSSAGGSPGIKVGDRLPDVLVIGTGGKPMRLTQTGAPVKLISIVPQLNMPVCDEQTHHFSEQRGSLDPKVQVITLSTNSADDQAAFAKKARIANITFLSDAPGYDFGRTTGLLLSPYKILHRAVLVVDRHNVIRYLQLVPKGELPNFDAAYEAAGKLLPRP